MRGLVIWLVVGVLAVAAGPAAAAEKDDQYVQELLNILEETHSVDAFTTAVHLLQELPVERHKIVPLVIRNAERLDIFSDHFGNDRKELAGEISTSLEKLSAKKPARKRKHAGCGSAARRGSKAETVADKSEGRTPILLPIRPDQPPPVGEEPTDAEVLKALPRLHGVPYLFEEQRDDIQITKERIVDKIDPPRFFPLVGPAQLHHCHWKCTVCYTGTKEVNYPIPFRVSSPQVEVIYIDKDCLHLSPPKDQTNIQIGSGYYY